MLGHRLPLAALILVCGVCSSPARATYSIAAVDQSTQQVGGAVTSCVGTLDVGIVYGALPGVGVIHAQAQLDQRGRAKARALELLMQGVAPSQIIQQITAPSFDSAYASRQYGVVDLMGRSAGYTGAQAQPYKRDQQGQSGHFTYSVQGNILTSQKVLDQAAAAFAANGCDLAERLLLALEAGAQNGEGDSRCTGQGIPSDSAFIQVELPGQAAGSYLSLSVQGTGPQSPLLQLRKRFDAWRMTHPCTTNMAAAGSGGGLGRAGASAGGAAGVLAGGAGASVAGATAGTLGASDVSRAGGGVSAAGSGASGPTALAGGAGFMAGNSNSAGAGTIPAASGASAGRASSAGAGAAGSTNAVPSRPGGAAAIGGTGTRQSPVESSASDASAQASGCSCSLTGRHASSPALGFLIALLSLGWRARRRRGAVRRIEVPHRSEV